MQTHILLAFEKLLQHMLFIKSIVEYFAGYGGELFLYGSVGELSC